MTLNIEVSKITPEVSDTQKSVIELAISQAWPKPLKPKPQAFPKWRFSRRWQK